MKQIKNAIKNIFSSLVIKDEEKEKEVNKLFEICGFTACPNDAVGIIKEKSNYVSSFNAGAGAVREIIEYIINDL